MPFEVKTFRISFMWKGKHMWEYVQAPFANEAIMIVQNRYPGATSFNWSEVR